MNLAEVLQTAAERFDPSDGIDLLGMAIDNLPAIISAVGVIIVGIITVRGQKKGRERWKGDRKMLNDVHRQTVNDHAEEDNFREQVDRMENKQEELIQAVTDLTGAVAEVRGRQIDHGKDVRGLLKDVGALRGEDREAERRQREFERRVQAAFRREHPDADPL